MGMVLVGTLTAFLEMMNSPEYAKINQVQVDGVAEHLILATNQTYSKFNNHGAAEHVE
jgi:hypothetical protein